VSKTGNPRAARLLPTTTSATPYGANTIWSRHIAGGRLRDSLVQETAGLLERAQQRLDALAQSDVDAVGLLMITEDARPDTVFWE
jgi:hypothetical protein